MPRDISPAHSSARAESAHKQYHTTDPIRFCSHPPRGTRCCQGSQLQHPREPARGFRGPYRSQSPFLHARQCLYKDCDVAATATRVQTFHSLVKSNPFQERRSSRQHHSSQEVQTLLAFLASADRVWAHSFRRVDSQPCCNHNTSTAAITSSVPAEISTRSSRRKEKTKQKTAD